MEKYQPAVPLNHLEAARGFQACMKWHKYSLEIFPEPFGNKLSLDVGCGGGGVMSNASALGWTPTGIDISEKNVESVLRLGFSAKVVDLNGNFPFENESFSLVTFIEVAEHLVRAEETFAQIYRVLTHGGKVLFTTPNNASYRRRIKALKGKAPDDEGYHFRFWVKDRLIEKLSSAGFVIEAINSYGYIPFVDTLTLYKLRTGRRRAYKVNERYESIFADRFVWLLRKD